MNNNDRFKLLLVICTLPLFTFGQTNLNGIINEYTEVISIDQCAGIIEVADASNFSIGLSVLLYQAKGATINETNSSAFGQIEALGGAGLYERNEIVAINNNTITLRFALVNEYDLVGQVQLVSMPIFDAAVVDAALFSRSWNGRTGGILAFEVTNTLQVDGTIDANGQGFRGGIGSRTTVDSCSSVTTGFVNTFVTNLDNWRGAQKGEGVVDRIVGKESARAPFANGGGGGNSHQTGGGGGAHHSPGGNGGELESLDACAGGFPGLGGQRLPLGQERLFLGGAGGGGHGNQGGTTDGGNGGGIIIIKADRITGNGLIVANGQNVISNAVQDGAGGGGAGGTIILDANTIIGNLTIEASGGNGGRTESNGLATCTGPGGGGSGGRIYATSAPNVTPNVSGGQAGRIINATSACDGSTNGATAGIAGETNIFDGFPMGTVETISSDTISLASCGVATGVAITYNLTYPNAAFYEYSFQVNDLEASPLDTITGNTLTINTLSPEDSVVLFLSAVAENGCVLLDTISCVTNNCDGASFAATTNINPLSCLDDLPVALTAIPDGGTFSGLGVDSLNVFTPATAGLGTTTILYDYIDSTGCPRSDAYDTEVVGIPAEPIVDCTEISAEAITFAWSSTSTQYRVVIRINGLPLGIPTITSDNTFTQTGLQNGDNVTIEVTAIGRNNCGDSPTTIQTCVAQSCDARPTINNLSPTICSDTTNFQVEATPLGGIFFGEGIDSTGFFQPSTVQIPLGQDRTTIPIIYEFIPMMGCAAVNDTVLVEVIQRLESPTLRCDSIAEDVVRLAWNHPNLDSFNVSYSLNLSPFTEPIAVGDTTFTLSNLMNQDVVEFVLEALSGNRCGNPIPVAVTCVTDICGADTASIVGLDSLYCSNQSPLQLTAIPSGGQFSGITVDESGLVDFALATIGSNIITYEAVDSNGCTFRDTAQFEVITPIEPPMVTCTADTVSTLLFEWTHPTATSFEYFYIINGDTTRATISDNNFTINDLPEDQEVQFFIKAVDNTICNGSAFATTTCSSLLCADVPPNITNLATTYCENDSTQVDLVGDPAGGTFQIDFGGVVSSFVPSNLGVGVYAVDYFVLDEAGCIQNATETFEVEALPEPIEIRCQSATAQSIAFAWDNPEGVPFEYNLIENGQIIESGTTTDAFLVLNNLTSTSPITIELISTISGACPPAVSTQTCQATSCPDNLNATVNLEASYCLEDENIQISATPNRGIFEGDGITADGVFNPSLAGEGIATITYTFEAESGCVFVDTFTTNIIGIPDAPSVNCGFATDSAVQFEWTHPDPAATFTYQVSLDGTNFSASETTDSTSLRLDNLLAATDVTIRISTDGQNGCVSSEVVELTCNTLACANQTVNITPIDDLCLGADSTTIQLEANIPDSVNLVLTEWIGLGITDAENGIFDPTDSTLTTGVIPITFTGLDEQGCPYVGQLDITVNQQPIAEAGDDQSLNCRDRVVTLDGSQSNGSTFQWTTMDGNLVASTDEVTAVADQPGAYFLEVSNGNCTAQDIVIVTENLSAPTADAGADQIIACENDSLTIGGDGSSTGVLYSWLGPDGFMSEIQFPIVTSGGLYQLIVTDTTNFCTSEVASVQVTDNSTPFEATLTTDGTITCATNEVTLTATTSKTDVTYQWRNENGILQDFSTPSSFTVQEGGDYSVVIRDNNGCEFFQTIQVAVDTIAPIANAGNDQQLGCNQVTVMLDGSNSSTGNAIQFTWGGSGKIDDPDSLTPTTQEVGIYILEVVNSENGCFARDTVEVTQVLNEISNISITTVAPLCIDDNNGRIIIDSIAGGQPPYLFSLDDDRFSAINQFGGLSPGTYEVFVQEQSGCTSSLTVEVPPAESLIIDIGDDQEIQFGDSIQLTALLTTAIDSILRIDWVAGPELVCSGCEAITLQPLETVVVRVEAENENGCLTTDQLTLFVRRDQLIYVPNAISPNGDGQNDFFTIFTGIGVQQVNNLRIYNRWGETIYQIPIFDTANPENGWDGTYNGQVLNPGVYIYTFEVEYFNGSTEVLTGEINLLR